jgi:hypothetical protein
VSWSRALTIGFLLLVLLPVGAATGCTMLGHSGTSWREARRDPSGQAPDPATTPEAVVQVYAARTVGIRGALGVHSWIALKPAGAVSYTRYEVIGWGVDRGARAVRVGRFGPDNHWFGSRPDRLADVRGPEAEALIPRIEDAVRSYPYPESYRTWPGPNSNTFVAHVARAVPELRMDLPPTAIGKDFLTAGGLVARSPSGTGYQVSVLGLLGVLVGVNEGIELNVLGLVLGVDITTPALKLPGIGRVGMSRSPGYSSAGSPAPGGSQRRASPDTPSSAGRGAPQAEIRR